jgi:hypothetical protein
MSSHEEIPDPQLEALAARLGNLSREAEPARELWPGIEARIAGTATASQPRRSVATLLRLAAAVLIFVSGVAVGRGWDRSASAPAPPVHDPLASASAVQRAGTEYVAAVAALRGEPRAEVRDQGREAALSTLVGAAHEIARMLPENESASQLLSTASRARQAAGRTAGRAIPF